MKIDIEQSAIEAAARDAVSNAIANAMNGWELQQATTKAVVEVLQTVDFPALVAAETERVLHEQAAVLVSLAVTDALPGVRAALTACVEQAHVAMVVGLMQGPPNQYDSASLARWRQAEARVRGVSAVAVQTAETTVLVEEP